MKYFVFLLSLVFICCSKESVNYDCVPQTHDSAKINGGSILETFVLSVDENEGTDIFEKTRSDWVALCPKIWIREYSGGGHRPYEFTSSPDFNETRDILDKVVQGGGRNIMVKPHPDFARAQMSGNFSGNFYLDTEEKWLEMEAAYTDFFMQYAALSDEFPEFRLFSIGNELKEFTKRRPLFFKGLIKRIREKHPNLELTYAANWDEYQGVGFWEDLDYVGINAYFPLVDGKTPTIERINEAYLPIKRDIKSLSCASGKPILFTEYGFRSIDNALHVPHELGDINGDNINYEAQSNGYSAFYDTFWDEPWVAGGFFWEWLAETSLAEPNYRSDDNGWYVNGKPAEKVIRERYSQR